MGARQIYFTYLKRFQDPRFLRFEKWGLISEVIKTFKVKTVLEFGSGVSSKLFSWSGMEIDSYETNEKFIERLRPLCPKVNFIHWNNKCFKPTKQYDLCLVDGPKNRIPQILIAIQCASIICLDDYTGLYKERTSFLLNGYELISSAQTLQIYKRLYKN